MSSPSTEFLDLQAALAGEYSLERELGRGALGVVYLARDVQLDRHVAIKVLTTHLADEPESREHFLRGARTASGLSHPNIVPIHRVEKAGGFVYIVMRYVAGLTLGERLRDGPLPAAEVMRVMREVSWALAYAHGRGVLHGDVKPDNILLEEGSTRAVVTDFGISAGTAPFISPEQAANAPLDGRSDLYALGVVGYLAATGGFPLDELSPAAGWVAPGVVPSLAAAIERCLQYEPAKRYDGGEALADALAPLAGNTPALPVLLRNWLRARNPLQALYGAWSGIMLTVVTVDVIFMVQHFHYEREAVLQLALAAAPLIPIIGFHINQARRLFRAGFTLSDLRAAIAVEMRERMEDDLLVPRTTVTRTQSMLRWGSYLSIAASAYFFATGLFPSTRDAIPMLRTASFPLTVVLLVLANLAGAPMLPESGRRVFRRAGIRNRLWDSRLGAWLAKRLGAPEMSRPVDAQLLRATEAALGVAVAELFAVLPRAFREQLLLLPGTVAALEARAAAARAEAAECDALAMHTGDQSGELSRRRQSAKAHLTQSVAALEGIRLDLLRLLSSESELAPLTTLLDAARLIGEDVTRLADAQRDVDMQPPREAYG